MSPAEQILPRDRLFRSEQLPETKHYLGLLTFPLADTIIQDISRILNLPKPLAKVIREVQAIKDMVPALKAAHHTEIA